jgi:exosortase A-associated hydrolase 2
VRAWFLPGRHGRLFCLERPAAGGLAGNDCVLVLPAFAEEMNKTRRMLCLLGDALQARGVSLFVPDLHGTGDSEGDFGDARFATWCDDLRDCLACLRDAGIARVHVLALRTGALLLGALQDAPLPLGRLLLWQPVSSGRQYVNQFLRLRLAGNLIAGNATDTGTAGLREELRQQGSLEIAGYRCREELLAAIESLELKDLPVAAFDSVACFELGLEDAARPSPAMGRVLERWSAAGMAIEARTLAGDPFWATTEIATVPGLVDATVAACATSVRQ